MYCSACGSANADDQRFCGKCGQPLTPMSGAVGSSAPSVAPPSNAAYAGAPPMASPSTVYAGTSVAPVTSGKATASLVCGILGWFIPILASIAAIVLGHIARSEIRNSGGRIKGDGIALTGLILGYLEIAIIPVILIIAAIAIPNLLRARIAANEASAVASVRTLYQAEARYGALHQEQGFTCDLGELASNGGLPELASGRRHGYLFRLDGCGPRTVHIYATPESPNQSGRRTFCATEDGVLRAVKASSAEDCVEAGHPI